MKIDQTGTAFVNYNLWPEAPAEAPNAAPPAEEAVSSEETLTEEWLLREAERRRSTDTTDIYETMRRRGEEEIKLWKKMLEDIQKANKKKKLSTQPPRINLQRLTQGLVSAVTPADVRGVLSQTGQAIGTLQVALSSLEGKQREQVRAMIASAQKLMDRCSRKIADLAQEDVTRGRQTKAEKTNQRKKAETIKQELRKQMAERARKEQRYLLERFPSLQPRQDGIERSAPSHPAQPLDPALEAKIEAMAEAILAAEASAVGGAETVATGGEFTGAEVSTGETGGEAAPAVSAEGVAISF